MTNENFARLLRGLTIAVGDRRNRILLYQFLAAEIRALHCSYGVGDGESYKRTGVKARIVGTCPLKNNDIPHPAFQWIWERQDISETAKKTMYWDCVFVANAFMKGDYPPPTAVPGMMELAIDIANARKLFHAACIDCKNIDCSGRDIDCGHKPFLEKISCEADKKRIMMGCEAKKLVCTSTCS
jgi:hypothetical protein